MIHWKTLRSTEKKNKSRPVNVQYWHLFTGKLRVVARLPVPWLDLNPEHFCYVAAVATVVTKLLACWHGGDNGKEHVFGKRNRTAWPFRGVPSSDHAVPTAAMYSSK
jgi:hypothetical protein